ncbi:MAG: response regulator [Eubacteriales bacterium]|nr:response regulator [Eubacteriales bacterium]
MFWHVDTEAVCLIIFVIFYWYVRKNLDWDEVSGKAFRRFTKAAVCVVAIDVVASLAMDFSSNWWFYQTVNNIYFISVPLLSVLWFLYTYILVHPEKKYRNQKRYFILSLPYLLLALGIASNPWTGWMYELTQEMVYTRGPLFWPTVHMQNFYFVMTALVVLLNWKKLSSHDRLVLLTAPVIESVATFIHLANSANGYLLMNSGYLIAYILVYLNIQGRQQEVKRVNAGKEQEFKRFISFIYRANEAVFEIDLNHNTRIDYVIGADGDVEKQTTPCDWEQLYQDAIFPEDLVHYQEKLSTEALRKLTDSSSEDFFEVRTKAPSGNYEWYAYTMIGLKKDELHPNNVILFKQNVNEQKSKEQNQKELLKEALNQAESGSRAKGDFMSRMSHEIRTPLNAIVGYLDIAQSEQNDKDKVAHCLEQSKVASRHLLSVINDVLDISSIESGRMKIAHDDFDLTQMINSLTTIFYAQAKKKSVRFEVSINELTEEWVNGDSLRVNQILLNLLSNAVKFTPENGEIRLDIHQLGLYQGKVHLQFQVSDTGIGMSKDYLSHVFQPFEQESAGIARTYGGSGLGLSICFNLVKMMDGTINVESEQGMGSMFTVMLAFDRTSQKSNVQLNTSSFSNLCCLVVDDEENACEYIGKLMERCGIKCETVTSGKKALRRIKSRRESGNPYDFCILDWNMPEMNGLDTAKEIRTLCGTEIPIIIVTAYDYSSIAEEALQVGVNRIVSKPLFQSTVFDMLVNTFGKYMPAYEGNASKRTVDFNGLRVILAEDNAMNMEIAQDILTKAGMIITPAVNGKEALDLFVASQPGTYAAILMDIQMPVMDGYESSRAIRKSAHPEAATIPIIAMTANAFTSDITAALAAGMNDHVAKPISYDRLYDALSKLTSKGESANEQ